MHTICLTYDCLNGEALESLQELFKYTGSSEGTSTRSQTTKSRDIKLTIPETNIGPVIKSSFILQALLFWNDLPDSIQNSTSKDIWTLILPTRTSVRLPVRPSVGGPYNIGELEFLGR
jgi:hypothetical protein